MIIAEIIWSKGNVALLFPKLFFRHFSFLRERENKKFVIVLQVGERLETGSASGGLNHSLTVSLTHRRVAVDRAIC